MNNLYLYGCGHRCNLLIELLKGTNIKLLGIIDSDNQKWGIRMHNFAIESPNTLLCKTNINVCVTFYSSLVTDPIWRKLESDYHISEDHIFTFHDIILYLYKDVMKGNNVVRIQGKKSVFFDASWGLGLGGVESWLKDIIKGFDVYQVQDIFLLTSKEQREFPLEIKRHIKDFFYENTMIFSEKYIQKGMAFLGQNFPCTVVFSRVNELLLSACILKREYPDLIKIIMVCHGSCDGMYRDILSYREMIDTYVCVSEGIRRRFVADGICPDIVHVMTVPIPSEPVLNRSYSLKRDMPIQIGYAGRLEHFEKRMDILMELINELESRKVNYRFHIAGSGSYLDEMRSFIQRNRLTGKVYLHGEIDRSSIPEFWRMQDIAVNTSDNEGRPISNMEAMINGAVPVVTETIGILDDVKDGKNGYIVPIFDYAAMADRIEHIEKNREELVFLGEAARETMLPKVSMESHIKFWLNLIEGQMIRR